MNTFAPPHGSKQKRTGRDANLLKQNGPFGAAVSVSGWWQLSRLVGNRLQCSVTQLQIISEL